MKFMSWKSLDSAGLGAFVGAWIAVSLLVCASAYWLGSQPLMESSAFKSLGLALTTVTLPGVAGFALLLKLKKRFLDPPLIYRLCFLALATTLWSFGVLAVNFATGFDRFVTGGNIVLHCHNRFDARRCEELLQRGGRAFESLPESTKALLKSSPRLESKEIPQ